MTLLSILSCLILERWQTLYNFTRQPGWLLNYAFFIQKHVKTAAVIRSWPGFLILILPIFIFVGLIQLGLNHLFYGIPGWFFNTLILLLCLDPHQIYAVLFQVWKDAPVISSVDNAGAPVKTVQCDVGLQLTLFNQEIFAVLFWFCLFGGVGAIVYRAINVWRINAILADSELNPYFSLLTTLNMWLDWLPVKLLTLSFALAGDFMAAFHVWIARFKHTPSQNDGLLKDVGTAALKHYKPITATVVQELAVRSLIIWLAILALMTITAVVQ